MQPNPPITKKKRLLVAAGIFVLPVVVICILLAGLLYPSKKQVANRPNGSAFNTELPSPNLPKGEKNKLEIYMQAREDSIKQSEERAKDPYASNTLSQTPPPGLPAKPGNPIALAGHDNRSEVVTSPFQDNNEKKVTERLQKIYAALGNQGTTEPDRKMPTPPPALSHPEQATEVDKLEKLMQAIRQTDTATNPQLNQVKQVLDEIKEIQHPEHAIPSGAQGAQDFRPLPVETHPVNSPDSETSGGNEGAPNGFFGLADDIDSNLGASSTIEAVVHADQVVQSGSIVKLRLIQPVYVGGEKIPANAFIYGPASISGERVTIQLTNAIYDSRIYPISLKVYDGNDGLDGLYVPGMITRDVVKQNMSQGVSGMSIGSLNPSLGAQAATATIETARNLLTRKITIVKATLKAGHLAILKPTGTQH